MIGLLLACSKGTDSSAEPSTPDSLALSDSRAGQDSPGGEGPELEGEAPRNILMISLDTTAVSWLGPLGGVVEMPHLEALFQESLVLRDHRSCSNWTYASVLCVQTGAEDLEQGYVPSSDIFAYGGVPEHFTMAPELLRDLGYQTGIITTNPYFSAMNRTTQGFQTEQMVASSVSVNTQGLQLLDSMIEEDSPWYLHLHYVDPHAPYYPPDSSYREEFSDDNALGFDLRDWWAHYEMTQEWDSLSSEQQATLLEELKLRYAAELSYFDEQLGSLMGSLESREILDETLIVFWTDHGEQFNEHGDLNHGSSLFDEENRAVASFRHPSLQPQAWSGPSMHQDIWPSVFRWMELPPSETFTGFALGERPEGEPRFANRHSGGHSIQMVEQSGLKLIYHWSGEKYFFDLESDPGEQTSLYDPEDERVLALWDLLMPKVESMLAAHEGYTAESPGP